MISALLNYEFMQNAVMAGLLIGAVLPFIGIIVMLRRLTFIADSLGHINMAGIAFTILLSSLGLAFISNSIIIMLWTICSAILIEYLRTKYTEYKELSIMIVYSLSIALTIIFLSISSGYSSSIFNVLFGNINAISHNELIYMFVVCLVLMVYVFLNYKKLILFSLDEDHAKLYNINTTRLKYGSMILIAIVITLAIKVVGVLLVSSLVSIPMLSAANMSKSLKTTYLNSIWITEVSILSGIILGYILNISTSAMIVVITLLIYLITSLIKK